MALLDICGAPLVIKPVVMQSEQRAVQQLRRMPRSCGSAHDRLQQSARSMRLAITSVDKAGVQHIERNATRRRGKTRGKGLGQCITCVWSARKRAFGVCVCVCVFVLGVLM